MKKLLLVPAALLAAASMHGADRIQDNVGIGLGTLIFEGHDGLISQISAATTNGSCGNQTFAITSGTLGAKKPADIFASREVRDFVRDNMDVLARDMAAGSGESLATLAELVGAKDQAAFAQTLQSSFGKVFTSATVSSEEVCDNLAAVTKA